MRDGDPDFVSLTIPLLIEIVCVTLGFAGAVVAIILVLGA